MHALIFGSTGKIGSDLLRLLNEDKRFKTVTAVVRRKGFVAGKSKVFEFNYKDWSKAERLFSNKTHVFCAIGTTAKKTPDLSDYHAIDVGIPLKIAEMAESARLLSLSVVSSVGADSAAKGFYLKTKGEMEERVKEAYHSRLYIMRPSILMGHRDEKRQGEKIGVIIASLINPLLRGSLTRYRGIDSADVARAMIHAALSAYQDTTAEYETLMKWSAEYAGGRS